MNKELDIENDIPEEHKQILDARIREYESGMAKTIAWEEAKRRLLGKGHVRNIDSSDTI